jgi:hypothetical protein
LLPALVPVAGCARLPYSRQAGLEGPLVLMLRPGEAQVQRGRPLPFLDGLGHYVLSLPSKLLLWNWRVDNHRISPETIDAMQRYLDDNGLKNVVIRVNQYAPGQEWRRLVKNREIGGFWRFTLGVLTTAVDTAFPGRAFGGDHYNPFTNSVHLYSDHPAIALHEAGHAKDFAGRTHKGFYAFVRLFPIVPLYQEGIASSDALSYMADGHQVQQEKDAYKVLWPAYATYIAGEGLQWTGLPSWQQFVVQLVCVIPAHIAGRIKAATVDE